MEHNATAKYDEIPLGGGFFGIANTKWSYTKSGKGVELGYGNTRVNLDKKTREAVTFSIVVSEETPDYIPNIDGLLFSIVEPHILMSPHGRIKLPENWELDYCDIPAGMTAAAIFAVKDPDRYDKQFYEKANFIAIRDSGDGKYSWAYLFPQWGMKTKTEATDNGYKLVLLKRGKRVGKPDVLGEIRLPEGIAI